MERKRPCPPRFIIVPIRVGTGGASLPQVLVGERAPLLLVGSGCPPRDWVFYIVYRFVEDYWF